jgi:hypothetical protein
MNTPTSVSLFDEWGALRERCLSLSRSPVGEGSRSAAVHNGTAKDTGELDDMQ